MKILLIQPPFTIFSGEGKKCHPPLGLAYLAAALGKDHDVLALDALAEGYEKEEPAGPNQIRYGLSFGAIKDRIAQIKPDVVAVSCLFSSQSGNVSRICGIAKEIDRGIVTVVGGAHPSSVPEEVLKDPGIDFVIIGEGEIALNDLLKSLKPGGDLRKIEGIGFKDGSETVIKRRAAYNEDLDSLPFPRWDIFPLDKYFRINNPHGGKAKTTPFLPMITSRGCPFECIFCSIYNLWGRAYRKRSAQNVLSEVEHLASKYGVREVMFEDDNLTLDPDRARRIFRGLIEMDPGIIWSVPNGVAVQTLDAELLNLMKRSGCYAISIGVESGDERMLKDVIRKPIKLSDVLPVIDTARDIGLDTVVFFVVGLPGETAESLNNTFRFAESLKTDNVNFFFANPLPGTRLRKECVEKGLINENLDPSVLKANYPRFSTGTVSARMLFALILAERLKLYYLSFIRNPAKFLRKLISKIF